MIMAALANDDNPAEPPPLPLPSKTGAAAALLEESTSYVGRVGLGGGGGFHQLTVVYSTPKTYL